MEILKCTWVIFLLYLDVFILDFAITARQVGLGHAGESTARSMFQNFDRNHNGRLDMSEVFGAISMLKGKRH